MQQAPPPDASASQHGNADASVTSQAGSCGCEKCAGRANYAEQFAYAIGHLDIRFPTLGIEREYQQRERALRDVEGKPRLVRIRAVLEKNPHIALRVGWILQIQGSPAYALSPASGALKNDFFNALALSHESDAICVAIGRVGPFTTPASFGGLLLPMLGVDQLYSFPMNEWADSLHKTASPALESKKIQPEHFHSIAREMFHDIVSMPENTGVSDGHRALNYLLVQHPGIFVAAAERQGHVLDRIETRILQASAARRHVAVILTFLERATGVPERLYCSVDVTEEWPFLVSASGSAAPIGLAPFIETAAFSAM
jgi:hypothetical protein